ncbi:hypothetical protein J6590_082143, partial [Homalodisca vitripennis]
ILATAIRIMFCHFPSLAGATVVQGNLLPLMALIAPVQRSCYPCNAVEIHIENLVDLADKILCLL